jgi:hypothetical protein
MLAVLSSFALMPVFAQTPAPVTPPQAMPQSSDDGKALRDQIHSTGRRGFLVEASRGGRKLFVYGGATVSRREYFPLNLPLMQALAQSTALLLDVDPGNSKALAQAAAASGTCPLVCRWTSSCHRKPGRSYRRPPPRSGPVLLHIWD